jgi:CRP/FNR family transcriptional regulator, nitrogen fixation regulation protein
MRIAIRGKAFRRDVGRHDATLSGRHPLRDLDGLAQAIRYDLDQRICDEARPSDCWHRIVRGAARRRLVRADGSRRTIDILVPGDYCGFFSPGDQNLIIEAAAEDTIASLYPRWCVEFLAEVDSDASRALRELELEASSRARLHLFSGLRMTAAAKVNSFLLQMSDRLSHVGPGWFDLPTSLDEIADYLELSAQTVEYCLTLLEERRAIASSGAKRIRILDRGVLTVVGDVRSSAGRPVLPFISQQTQRRGLSHLDRLVTS